MFIELALASVIIALLFAFYRYRWIMKSDPGTPRAREISSIIYSGAMSYLNSQYRYLSVFVLASAIAMLFIFGLAASLFLILGSFLSALSGNIGMRVATRSNARAAHACTGSKGSGLSIAFSSGMVTGMCVVGLGLVGVLAGYVLFRDPTVLFGFGFGASSVALFARVGGGIYTKAADVGADLVGKVEQGIPEDDPRNPAVIADNVGDNVGDVAGMGADLFESYVESIIAAVTLGLFMLVVSSTPVFIDYAGFALAVAALGIFSAVIASFFVRPKKARFAGSTLNIGIYTGALVMAVLTWILSFLATGSVLSGLFISVLSGLAAGLVIGFSADYYTSSRRGPAIGIAKASETGAGTNIITGFSVGLQSTALPILVVTAATILSFSFEGVYGVAIAAVGMLSTLGVTLAAETYGAVADNAAGIAEMAGLGKEARRRAEELDAAGNTTAAIGKGFAIGSAALTTLALFAVYSMISSLSVISLTDPFLISGVFIGGMLPFLFSSITMKAVSRTAFKMVNEVRRQFRETKGLLQGKAKPDYNRCIAISANAAVKEMLFPSILAIASPALVAIILGKVALGGMLLGSMLSGFLLAITMANAGGAWDNAKKHIEAGNLGGKGSEAHKASVVGDTVGDPMKDCSGPSLNILIKLVSIVAIIIAGILW